MHSDDGGRDGPRGLITRRGLGLGLFGLAAAGGAGAAWAQTLQAETPEQVLELSRDLTLRMAVPVKVNGAGPYKFVVDTGASHSVLSAQVGAALGLPQGEPVLVHGVAGAAQAPTATGVRFSYGDVSARLPRVPLLPVEQLGCDGLLGLDVLRSRVVTLDFSRQIMRISRSNRRDDGPIALRISNNEVRVRARPRSGQLTLVDARVAGVPTICFIDSGADRSIGNQALRRAVGARVAGTAEPILVRGATGQSVRGEVGAVPNLDLGGGIRLATAGLVFADIHPFELWGLTDRPALLLGMDLLWNFDEVAIDYGRREVRFRVNGPRRSRVR